MAVTSTTTFHEVQVNPRAIYEGYLVVTVLESGALVTGGGDQDSIPTISGERPALLER